jgi:hypothetical protein
MRTTFALLALAACQGPLDQRLAIVRDPRVLAIAPVPPEAKPGAAASYRALAVGPEGPIDGPLDWSLCTAPKPPTADNAVSDACLGDAALIALGTVAMPAATIPGDACSTFGPDVPPGGFRPRDPDATGGFYQPVRAALAATDLAFGFTRITCDLATAPPDVAHAYLTMYVANQAPVVALDAPAHVTAGTAVAITASWPPDAAESYLYYDPVSQTLVVRREAMRVSWFATGGALPVDGSAVDEADLATSVSTTWQAPSDPGPAWLWIVLRDSRGGIATTELAVSVD